jgi:hypothetical protein
MNKQNILRYWHAIELLQPQSAPELKKRERLSLPFLHDVSLNKIVLPWFPESILNKQQLPENTEWSHTLYAHLYDGKLVAEKLKSVFGADQGYQEPAQPRESALFSVKFTHEGKMVENSLVLSSEAWFLGRVLTGLDWASGFDEDVKKASEQSTALLTGEVSSEALLQFTNWMREFIGVTQFFNKDNYPFRFRSQPVAPNKRMIEDDPLNSFLLEDIDMVVKSIGNGVSSDALNNYLSLHDSNKHCSW